MAKYMPNTYFTEEARENIAPNKGKSTFPQPFKLPDRINAMRLDDCPQWMESR